MVYMISEMDSNSGSYRLTLAAVFFAAFCVFVTLFTSVAYLPLYVRELGGGPALGGLQNTVYFFSGVLLRFYLGPLADRRGRRVPLLIGTVVSATAPLAFAAAGSIPMLMLARVYHAISLGAFLSAASSLVADCAPPEKRGVYIGAYRFIVTSTILIGPPIAEYCIGALGFRGWFLVSAAFHALAIPGIAFMSVPRLSKLLNTDLRGGFMRVLRTPAVARVLGGVALLALSYSAVLSYLPLLAESVGHSAGLYFMVFGSVGLVANVVAGGLSDRVGRGRVAGHVAFVLPVAVLLLSLDGHPLSVFLASAALGGIGFSAGLSVAVAWLVDLVSVQLKATTLALQESTIDTFMALGALLFGALVEQFGLGSSFLYFGLSSAALTFVLVSRGLVVGK
ncbi:MAG: MFS transporter [Spirochaetaceae bacterium]|nr:MAG: MFS transporter [Spirochaetaceae bacterium]